MQELLGIWDALALQHAPAGGAANLTSSFEKCFQFRIQSEDLIVGESLTQKDEGLRLSVGDGAVSRGIEAEVMARYWCRNQVRAEKGKGSYFGLILLRVSVPPSVTIGDEVEL